MPITLPPLFAGASLQARQKQSPLSQPNASNSAFLPSSAQDKFHLSSNESKLKPHFAGVYNISSLGKSAQGTENDPTNYSTDYDRGERLYIDTDSNSRNHHEVGVTNDENGQDRTRLQAILARIAAATKATRLQRALDDLEALKQEWQDRDDVPPVPELEH